MFVAMEPQMATFDNFNSSKVYHIHYENTLLICELVYGETNRRLIYFQPLHAPKRSIQFLFYEKRFLAFISQLKNETFSSSLYGS